MLMLDEEDLFHWGRRPRLLIMRNREIPPLKGVDVVDVENHRGTTLNRHDSSSSSLIPPSSTNSSSHPASTGSLADLTVTGNNNYRPLTINEKLFTDEWAKKLSIKSQPRKDVNPQSDNPPTTNPLQFRPAIPRRPSPARLPASHNLLITSHIHNYQEQKPPPLSLELDPDENNETHLDTNPLNHSDTQSKSTRAVHSSSTRRKVDRLFGNGTDPEVSTARTLISERNNENRTNARSRRETDPESNVTNKSVNKPQLFSTKPRLARSGSKPKMEKAPAAPLNDSSSSHVNEHSSHVEVIGRGYHEEKVVPRRLSNENLDEKPVSTNSKGKAKIIKGSVVSIPYNSNAHSSFHNDDEFHPDDEQDIGVIGKAVHIPTRSQPDEQYDLASDEFDSDSKENENFVEMNQSLSASFRLRVKQKTQEKIEQKERRRQDREVRHRQEQFVVNNTSSDTPPVSSAPSSRYSSQPDLTTMSNEHPPATTPKRATDPMTNANNSTSILPNVPSQQRHRNFKNSMARSQTFNNRRELSNSEQRVAFHRPLSEDRITDQLRNPQSAYREAMESIASDDWEQKCSGLNLLQLLVAEYPDMITQNLHQVVLVLIAEIRNLRSQVARFALSAMADMFKYLQRNMDIELDITVKALIHKSADSNDFFKSDTEKCLQTMIDNVTLQKALQALIAGGATHRNPAARKTTAKYIYLVCEKLGPTKILNGSRDITERVLQVAAGFASDGPPEIRWYGKKIYHMLMPYDDLDSMMKHYLNATAYTNMCEILDNIRAKGGVGETPSESARNNVRRTLSNDKLGSNGLTSQFPSTRKINTADQVEQVREITKLLRSADFRDRLNGIEEFQKLCELETETAIQSLVPIFDGFNECLAHMNSKVVLKALNTMHQLVPILADSLSSVINSALPLVAQNIASNNREIAELASDIIDAAIEYIDCGVLIQPLCILSQTSNLRVRPEIVLKLAIIVPHVCQRKPKQVEIHLLPAFWKLLSLLRGQNATTISSSASGPTSLNSSIHVLTKALYTELGDGLLDRASSSSAVPPANLQMLRELCANLQTV